MHKLISILAVIIIVPALVFVLFKAVKMPANELASKEIDSAICDPANGPFSTEITNPYLPYIVGFTNVLQNDKGDEVVTVTSLNETEVVAGVTTRVIEERKHVNGKLHEVARNFYVQASDGTVCYFGEDVTFYDEKTGAVLNHDGEWKVGGTSKPGIVMTANPEVGQTFWIENAPGIAEEKGEIIWMGQVVQTPYAPFTDTIYIKETQPSEASDKYYARGFGMVEDDGLKLVSHNGKKGSPTQKPSATKTATKTLTPAPTKVSSGTNSPMPTSVAPPPNQAPTNEELIKFSELPASIQATIKQRHPVHTILEVKKETYSNGALVYATELIIDGSQWDIEILPDGKVIRDDKEINP